MKINRNILFSIAILCGHLLQVPLCAMETETSSLSVKKVTDEDWNKEWGCDSDSDEKEKETPIELRVSVFDEIVEKLVGELQKPSEFQLFLDDFDGFIKKYQKVDHIVKQVAVGQLLDQKKIRLGVYEKISTLEGTWHTSRCKQSWQKLLQLKTRDSLAGLGINWEIRGKRIFDCDLQKEVNIWWYRPNVPEWLGGNKQFCGSSWFDGVGFTKHGDIMLWFTAKAKNGLPTNDKFACVTPFKMVKKVYDFFENLNTVKVMVLLYFTDDKLQSSEWYKKNSKKLVPGSVKTCLRRYYKEKNTEEK